MSGFIITLICQVTHYSLVTSQYAALIVSCIFVNDCDASALHRVFQLESKPASLSSPMIQGFTPLCALKERSKGRPFLLLSAGSDQVSLFWFTPQTEAASGNISLQWPSRNSRLATDYWRWWPLLIRAYAAAYTRPPRQSEGGTWVSQAHPQGEHNYFLSINQNGHALSGGFQ